jgi:hypothetical protein
MKLLRNILLGVLLGLCFASKYLAVADALADKLGQIGVL